MNCYNEPCMNRPGNVPPQNFSSRPWYGNAGAASRSEAMASTRGTAPAPACGMTAPAPMPTPACGTAAPIPMPTPACGMAAPAPMPMPASDAMTQIDWGRFPIGMGYVPMQTWQQPYSLERGFQRGTIFPELDLPFMMGRCR